MTARHGGLTAAAVAAVALSAAPARAAEVYGPSEKVEQLKALPDDIFDFIVRGPPEALAAARGLAAADPSLPAVTELPLIDGLAVPLRERDAEALAARPGVQQVWYLHRDMAADYIRILQAFTKIHDTGSPPIPMNLSLGPPATSMPLTGHDEEPMNLATHKLADKGFIAIFAIGNYYQPDAPNPGEVNPWCHPVWVICVGAATPDAKQLFGPSARGLKSDPSTWPSVVANGVDVISSWPTYLKKTPQQRQHDESSPAFQQAHRREQWDAFTMMSGTSQSTPQVTRAAAQIIWFVEQTIIANPKAQTNLPIFTLTFPPDRLAAVSRGGPRLTGDVGAPGPDGVEITYRWVEPWKLVKQLLRDTAVPMTGFGPDEVGAGFVEPAYVEQQFGRFGKPVVKVEALKVEN